MSIWDILKTFAHINWKLIVASIGSSILSRLIHALILSSFIVEIFNSRDMVLMGKYMAMYLFFFSIDRGLYMVSNNLSNTIEPQLTDFLTTRLITGVVEQYEFNPKGIEVALIIDRINAIRTAAEDLMYYICFKIFPLIFVLCVSFMTIGMVNLKLFFFILTSKLIVWFLLSKINLDQDINYKRDELDSLIEDMLYNLEFILSTSHGHMQMSEQIHKKSAEFKRLKQRVIDNSTRNQALGYFYSSISYIATILFLYKLYEYGEIDIKFFESYILIIGKLFDISFDIAYYVPIYIKSYTILKNSDSFVSSITHSPVYRAVELTDNNFNIYFKEVSFYYGKLQILDRFTKDIPLGSLVAVYGPSGSGKTTFINLIRRCLIPTTGHIYIGNINTVDISPRELRKYINVVKQNTHSLLQGTIYQNIVFGHPHINERYLMELIDTYNLKQIFNAETFLDIYVTKNGMNLSGGQKQIIHLLHAILNEETKILILDEPTSALDIETRDIVIDLIKKLQSPTKTIIIITHDPKVKALCPIVIDVNRKN